MKSSLNQIDLRLSHRSEFSVNKSVDTNTKTVILHTPPVDDFQYFTSWEKDKKRFHRKRCGHNFSRTKSSHDPSRKKVDESWSNSSEKINYHQVISHTKALWGKPVKNLAKLPCPDWNTIRSEEIFIKNPTLAGFLRLDHEFQSTMRIVGHQKFCWVDDIAVPFTGGWPTLNPWMDVDGLSEKIINLEEWHETMAQKFGKKHDKTVEAATQKHLDITERGLGRVGKMAQKIAKIKEASFFAKNNCTIRGNVFKMTHEYCPKNIFEIMPRFGYRKGAHVGVRVSQFTINAILSAIGYALTPVTFGVSKYLTSNLSTVVTLTGESITHRVAGAEKIKVATHASLRGVQLVVPGVIPFVGTIAGYAENAAMGSAAFGIVSTTIADAILGKISSRYTSLVNVDDLGDSRCLKELNQRIDYLAQFLLPYGQYLLLKEGNMENRRELKHILKMHFKTLRKLEKDKIQSLNFYRLALAADRIPESHREQIRIDCELALPETRINTHRIVRSCLSKLIACDANLSFLKPEKMPLPNLKS